MKAEVRMELQELSIKAGEVKNYFRRVMERHDTNEEQTKAFLIELIGMKKELLNERLPERSKEDPNTDITQTEVLGATQTVNVTDARNNNSKE